MPSTSSPTSLKGDVLGELTQLARGAEWKYVINVSYSRYELAIALAAIGLMLLVHQLQERKPMVERIAALPALGAVPKLHRHRFADLPCGQVYQRPRSSTFNSKVRCGM